MPLAAKSPYNLVVKMCSAPVDGGAIIRRHSSVDDLAWAYFEVRLQRMYVRARGTSFQTLFVDIMTKAHGSDFFPTRPWGATGDKKCDGYLKSTRNVFAVYAPRDFTNVSRAKRKITSDHKGALKHWKPYMERWTLVHNDEEGLGPDLVQLLLRLSKKDAAVQVDQWGFDKIRATIRSLDSTALTDLFGTVPTARDVGQIRQDDLKAVIDDLGAVIEYGGTATATEDLRQVPAGKVEFNLLGPSVQDMLAVGWRYSSRVTQFFNRHPDPELEGRIVGGFQKRYAELREQGLSSDVIFAELQAFAGGVAPRSPKLQVAALAVLAHLLEACHIFERPPDVQ